ncbi:MAG: response regulator transcription factor [Gemmataceae bacterium]
MGNLRVLLADDHAVVRAGLKALLDAQPDLSVVGEAADGLTAVELAGQLQPDVAVVDVSMPGLGGGEVTEGIARDYPRVRVVALTAHEESGYVRRLLAAGAAGYVLKRSAADELVRAVRAVAAGEGYLDPGVAGGVVERLRDAPPPATAELSERETEVVRLIAHGYSNKEIAAKLGLSVKTVETYKTRSLEKLGLRSRVDIVRYAAGRGWLATM